MTNIDSAIKQANEFLAMGGIRLKIQRPEQTSTLYLRGTWASIGQEKKSQRIALGIKATSAGIEEAKELAREAWIVIKAGGDPKASLKARQTALRAQNTPLTGSEAIAEWERRERADHDLKPNTNDGFTRKGYTVRGLLKGYENASLTSELLVALVERAPAGSNRRKKEKSAALQIAKANSLNTTAILEIKAKYKAPKRPVPESLEQLQAFLDALQGTEWGWCTAAHAIYGCRVNETASLVPKLGGKLADCLTIDKREGGPQNTRTAIALSMKWVERYKLTNVYIPGDFRWTTPDEYIEALKPLENTQRSSSRVKCFENRWRAFLRDSEAAKAARKIWPEYNKLGVRHYWGIQAALKRFDTYLAARAMGHSMQTHENTYLQEITAMQEEDVLAKLIILD
jgi:uncharacterized Ntn-hydrolase superfamily protein